MNTMTLSRAALATGAGVMAYAGLRIFAYITRCLLSPIRNLKGPKETGSFALGLMPDLDAGRSREWVDEFGKVMKLRSFLGEDALFTVDTKALNHVLMHPMDYVKPEGARQSLSHAVGPGLLVAEGEQHKLQRRIMNPAFSPSTVRALTSLFHQEASRLRELIASELPGDTEGKRLNVIAYLSKATLDIIGLAGFGYHFNALDKFKQESELSKAFATLFSPSRDSSFVRILHVNFPITRILLPTAATRRNDKAQANMRRIGIKLLEERKAAARGMHVVDEKIDDGIAEELGGKDLLSILVKANTDPTLGDSKRLSDEDVLGQVPTFFVAGHETTSTQTTWCLFELAKHPEIQSKLREELLQVPTDTPTMDELNDLPYLEMITRETLRFHPAVPRMSRVADHDDVLPLNEPFMDAKGKVQDGIKVKKGDRVLIAIRVLNRLKEIWGEDADEFKPERWTITPEKAKDLPGVWGNLMTFSGGSRSCIGYRFALVEMKVLLFALLRTFEFSLAVPEEDIVSKSMVVTRPYLKDNINQGSQMPLMVKLYSAAA